MTTAYTLTLCDPDGTLRAVVPDAPVLPRFMHVVPEKSTVELSDHAEPDSDEFTADDRVITFARIASAVWTENDRGALFVRIP